MNLEAIKARVQKWDRAKTLPPGNGAVEALHDMENHLEQDLREAIAEIERLQDKLREVLIVLPDGRGAGEEDWEWAWNELNTESQALVKKVRAEAEALLKEGP